MTTRIEEELKGKPTGFDVLLATKAENLKKLYKVIREHPEMSRQEMADAVGVSVRTIYRYGVELRKIYKKSILKTSLDEQIQAKKERVIKLRRLVKEHPEYSRRRLCTELGVSWRTLYVYLKEL